MKQLIRLSLVSSLVINSSAFAFEPIQKWYGGINAGITNGPAHYSGTVLNVNTGNSFYATVNNSVLGGGGGAQLGYRLRSFRVEGEVFYSYIGSGSLTSGSCTLESPNAGTPSGVCPPELNGIGFNGSSTSLYGMVNGYYDFYPSDPDSSVVPYVGFGIGIGDVTNRVNFVDTINGFSKGGSASASAGAAQAIIGVSYFMDDYAWIGMDYRYLTTSTITNSHMSPSNFLFFTPMGSANYVLNTLNFYINFSFDTSTE